MSDELVHISGWLVLGGVVGYASTKWSSLKAKYHEKIGIPKLHWEKKTELQKMAATLGTEKIETPRSVPTPPIAALPKEVSAAQARLDYKRQGSSKRIRFDSHKRKGLQPSKNRPMPKGDWIESKETVKALPEINERPKKVSPPPKEHFTHKFFGTSLSVGGKVLYGGLSSGMHTMEITKEGLFIIDNKVLQVNPGDLERIKEMIRASRA